MSDRYFVDTNILMYAHDTSAGEKRARAKAARGGIVEEQIGCRQHTGPAGISRQPPAKGKETSGREGHA